MIHYAGQMLSDHETQLTLIRCPKTQSDSHTLFEPELFDSANYPHICTCAPFADTRQDWDALRDTRARDGSLRQAPLLLYTDSAKTSRLTFKTRRENNKIKKSNPRWPDVDADKSGTFHTSQEPETVIKFKSSHTRFSSTSFQTVWGTGSRCPVRLDPTPLSFQFF